VKQRDNSSARHAHSKRHCSGDTANASRLQQDSPTDAFFLLSIKYDRCRIAILTAATPVAGHASTLSAGCCGRYTLRLAVSLVR
jgi:hypothetical protein